MSRSARNTPAGPQAGFAGERAAPRVFGRVRPAPESAAQDAHERQARRSFIGKALALGAGGAAGGALAEPREAPGGPGQGERAILDLPDHTKGLGQPVAASGYGVPSRWEANLQRRESPGLTRVSAASVSFTPLQGLFGIITPNGLHFERHHQGWWDVDREHVRCVLAEGADGSSMTRTIAIDRALDDVIVAWAMNGEMLRPENGYRLRLVVPGVQGVSWVKYLRRIEVGDRPWQVSTLWDYIRRAMPWNAPKSLCIEEVYAVTACILNLADVVPGDFVLSDRNMLEVQHRLPNRDGMFLFDGLWRVDGTPDVRGDDCMHDCTAAPWMRSTLPAHARDSHGNLRDPNRLVGPVRGADTTKPSPDAAPQAAPARP